MKKGLSIFTFLRGTAIVLGAFLLVASVVYAATTIGTNITTGGTLDVSGNSTFGDAATDVNLFTGTFQATSTALFTDAITTYAGGIFGDAATDVQLFNGSLQATSTLLVTGATVLYGNVNLGDAAADVIQSVGTLQASSTVLFTRAILYNDATSTSNLVIGAGKAAATTTLTFGSLSSTANSAAGVCLKIRQNGAWVYCYIQNTAFLCSATSCE